MLKPNLVGKTVAYIDKNALIYVGQNKDNPEKIYLRFDSPSVGCDVEYIQNDEVQLATYIRREARIRAMKQQ